MGRIEGPGKPGPSLFSHAHLSPTRMSVAKVMTVGPSFAITSKVPVTVISLFIVAVLVGVVFVVWQLLLIRLATRSQRAANPPPDVSSGTDSLAAGADAPTAAEAAASAATLAASAAEAAAAAARSAQQQLIELKRLRDQDLISGEEFAARRQAIIDSASSRSPR
jgi:hypothetical protein